MVTFGHQGGVQQRPGNGHSSIVALHTVQDLSRWALDLSPLSRKGTELQREHRPCPSSPSWQGQDLGHHYPLAPSDFSAVTWG